MDFLMLFGDYSRVVIEVDGKQHYADGDRTSPARYAEMVAEDRTLLPGGYEVYRFGGAELLPDDPRRRRNACGGPSTRSWSAMGSGFRSVAATQVNTRKTDAGVCVAANGTCSARR